MTAADLVDYDVDATGGPWVPTAWNQPSPLVGHVSLPRFPVHAFPGWIADEIEAIAEFTQTPTDLPSSVALAVLATAAGGRAVVQVRGTWREPTNLYVVIAMPPGSRKSAVFAELTAPLLAGERQLVEDAEPRIREAATLLEIALQEAQQARATAAKAEGSEREQRREDAVHKAAMAEALTVPAMPRLVADDITPEAAASLLAEQGGRLSVLSAEGGIFGILAGRYTSGAPSIEVFLKGHSGDMLRIDRKGRAPEHVSHPALTLGLTVQPDVLRAIHRMPGFRGRGLLARILYALPPDNLGRRRIGTDPVPVEVSESYDRNIRALVASLADWTDPAVLTLTPEAAELHLVAEREIEPKLAVGADLGELRDWASKLIGATARIAGLLHLATHLTDGWGRPIEAETMSAAISVAGFFTSHAVAAFEAMGADETTDNARAVLDWAVRHGHLAFTRREAHQAHRSRFPAVVDIDPALARLEESGWIRPMPEPEPRPKGGRPPSPAFEVNPIAHNSQNPHNPPGAGGL